MVSVDCEDILGCFLDNQAGETWHLVLRASAQDQVVVVYKGSSALGIHLNILGTSDGDGGVGG